MKHLRTYGSPVEMRMAQQKEKRRIGNLTPKGKLLKAVDLCLDEGRTREQILLLIDNYIYKMEQQK